MIGSPYCAYLEPTLSAYADHEASAEEVRAVEAHLRRCAECAARLEQLRSVAARLEADTRALVQASPTRVLRSRSRCMRWPGQRPSLLGAWPGVLLARAVAGALLLGLVVGLSLVLLHSAPSRSQLTAAGATPTSGSTPPPSSVSQPSAPRALVIVASVDGVVDGATASYLRRAVSTAAARDASALVISLDTSGGLETPVRDAVRQLAASRVPTLAYIGRGAHADAAGAVLAASTTLLAAADSGGSGVSRAPDLVAPDVAALVRALDGGHVVSATDPTVLFGANARIESIDMSPTELLAHRLFDPSLAYVLFVIGLYAVFVELAHPGAFAPGVTGLVCLGLALVAFTTLPINLLGLVLIVAAVGLIALDVKLTTHGGLTLGGVLCLVIGSLVLYARVGASAQDLPEVSVAPPVVAVIAGTGVLLGLLLAQVAASVHRLPPVFSLARVEGARGTTRGVLNPDGVVSVQGELWSARVRAGQLGPDEPVRVIARHGLVLEVESTKFRGAATQKGASR